MKPFSPIIPIFMLAALASCYRDEPAMTYENRNEEPLTGARGLLGKDEYSKNIIYDQRFKITSEKAAQLALEYVSVFETGSQEPQIMSTSAPYSPAAKKTVRSVTSVTDKNLPVIMTCSLNTEESADTDTLVHIVNFSDNAGYAFMSTDERDGALIAYSSEGNFNIEDTVGNRILAFHVDLILNYAKGRKAKKRQMESDGLDYFGDMEITTPDEDNPIMAASGMPGGGGLPGGGTGGLPGGGISTNCTGMPDHEWKGNEDAIEIASKRYSNGCFGKETPPPQIDFQPGPPGYLGPGTECISKPYCEPPVFNYDTYYRDYGCYLEAWKSFNHDVNDPVEQIGPYTKTAWSQDKPLNKYCNGYGYDVGCAALAILQIFNYYNLPMHYTNTVTSPHINLPTGFPSSPSFIYNNDMLWHDNPANQSVDFMAKFVRQIGKDLGMVYLPEGSGPPGLASNMNCIRDVLLKYGYKYDYIDENYMNDDNFGKIRKSLEEGKLVFIYGFRRGWTGVLNYFDGHCWIIDGYKRTFRGSHIKEFRIDEWGNYNYTKEYSVGQTLEYISNNYGNNSLSSGQWVLKGVYNNWDKDDYSGRLRFMSGIEPNNR